MNPCVMWGGGMVSSPCHHMVQKTNKMKQKAHLTKEKNCFPAYYCAENDKNIAGASTFGSEGNDTAFPHGVIFVLFLHRIFKLDIFRNLKRSWTVLDVRSGSLFGKIMDTSRQLAVVNVLHSWSIQGFLCQKHQKGSATSVPHPAAGVVQTCFRLSRPNISQALLRHSVSNGVFLGWCPRHPPYWGAIKRGKKTSLKHHFLMSSALQQSFL